MDYKHRKLFVVKQSKWCKLMSKMHQIRLAARLHPDPLGELMHFPKPLATMGRRLLLRAREGAYF